MIRIFHSTPRSQLASILSEGLRAVSQFDDLGLEMRRQVVYCWLSLDDDKRRVNGQHDDHVYVEAMVEEERCTVADMEWSSLALMYRQGMLKPKNLEAARLLAEVYRVTAVPLSEYAAGMFWTPEVLVRGDIPPDRISFRQAG